MTQVTNSMKTVKLNQIVLLFSCFHEKAYLCPRVSVLNDLRFRYLKVGFLGLHVEVSFGKILNPKLLLMCWSASCMAATTTSV